MNWQLITSLFIASAVVIFIIYDLVAYAVYGNEATISRLCLETADTYRGFAVAFAFSFGLLMGHLFLPQHLQTTPTQQITSPSDK